MKKYLLLTLMLFSSLVIGAINIDVDSLKSPDQSKTWTMPSSSGQLQTNPVNMGTDTTGILGVSNGGTAKSTWTDGIVKIASNSFSSSLVLNSDIDPSAGIAYSKLAPLSTGQVLLGNAGVPTATTLSGGATVGATGVVTLGNSAVITQLLTGYASGAGTVSSSDTIIQAIQKIDGNDKLKLGLTKSDSDVSPVTTTQLNVPNSQLTTSGTNTRRIETGNHNLIKNPSGEYDTSGWTGSGIQRSSSTSTDGEYSFSFDPASGARQAYQSFSVPSGLIGREIEYSVDVNSSGNLKICAVNEEAEKCETYIGGSGSKRITILHKPTISTNAFYIQRPTTTATTYEYFDNVYVGMRRAIDVFVSDVKNSADMESCGLTAADFINTGTPSEFANVMCAKDGEDLVISGAVLFTTAMPTAQFRMNLKFKGQSLTVNSKYTRNTSIGTWFRENTIGDKGGAVLVNGGQNYLTLSSSSVFGSTSTNPIVSANSNLIVNINERIFFTNVRIPIAEWANSSLDVAATRCQLGNSLCASMIQFTYAAGASVATDQFGISYPVTKSLSGNAGKTINITSLGLSNALECSAGLKTGLAGEVNIGNTNTNTSLLVATASSNGAGVDLGFSVSCNKIGTDIKNPFQFTNLQNFYVDANEIQVGFDRIENKTIFQRCFRFSSDATTNLTVLTWPANFNPVKILNYTSDEWVITNVANNMSSAEVRYVKSSGNVRTVFTGSGAKIGAGTTVCMEYTKN